MSEATTIFVTCDGCQTESTIWTPPGNDGATFQWDCSLCSQSNWALAEDGIRDISEIPSLDEEIFQILVSDGAAARDGTV